ncbi:MAG: mannitol dehydrogenase family protein [Clostridia bacterium]|nr:mannitol dehydrogenase family protein [Clostridia bacterium]
MFLSYQGIQDTKAWSDAGITLPAYDWKKMAEKTAETPVWVHFGAGNIFRGFIAGLQQRLLNQGNAESGIIAAETFDFEIIDKIYDPHDSMTLMVSLCPDGSTKKEVISSIACGIRANTKDSAQWNALKSIFVKPSLQMASFTITEKGYALRNIKGELTGPAAFDMENGPDQAVHAMGVVCALMYARYQAGAYPMALVSMDNCSHNGEKLRTSVLEMAEAWEKKGFVDAGFVSYIKDESRVSFPWSMIDKITPRPAAVIEQQLRDLGVEDMAPVITSRNTYIAAFVNAEVPQYLVVEDRFPNGRPALEKAGVYMTDRDTVNKTERMKVTTCLNPLHTALAVYGCLLNYTLIADEMKDEDLVKLVHRIGYVEGLPVVTDPGIISPRAFIDEVIGQRLPNVFMPDTPQRIATDTSQKIPIRFGETIKSYMADPSLDPSSLKAISLALAGWIRYLLGINDEGKPMEVSSDPMLSQLQSDLAEIHFGDPDSVKDHLDPILHNSLIFGVDLFDAGLADRVKALVAREIAGPGAVRATLKAELA